jgi:hypothetical protein
VSFIPFLLLHLLLDQRGYEHGGPQPIARSECLLLRGHRRRAEFLEGKGHCKNSCALGYKVANLAEKCFALVGIDLAPAPIAIDKGVSLDLFRRALVLGEERFDHVIKRCGVFTQPVGIYKHTGHDEHVRVVFLACLIAVNEFHATLPASAPSSAHPTVTFTTETGR